VRKGANTSGFTLPLVMISLAALLVLMTGALMVSRNTQKAISAQTMAYRLELALESAQDDAVSLLVNATNRDSFITHQHQDAQGDPAYYLVSWFEGDDWWHQPLYSGAALQSVGHAGRLDRYVSHTDVAHEGAMMEMQNLKFSDSDEESRLTREVPAITLQDAVTYGYWIEDLGGRLDYEVMSYDGGVANHSYESSITDPEGHQLLTVQEDLARREMHMVGQQYIGANVLSDDEEGTGEYPMDFTRPLEARLPNPESPSQVAPPEHIFAELREKQVVPYALNPSIVASEVREGYEKVGRYLNVRRPESLELDLIPHGHDYPLAGQEVKANLNAWIRRAETAPHQVVNELSEWMKQVPGFKDSSSEYQAVGMTGAGVSHTRYGGLRQSESYTKTLAANIIDYADLNSDSTTIRPLIENTDTGVVQDTSAQHYRGIDAMPLLSEVARRYELIANLGENANGRFSSVVEVRTFIELWNPTNLPIQGYVKYTFHPHWTHSIDLDGDGRRDAKSLAQSFPEEELYYWGGLLALQPNEYKVIEVTNDRDGDFLGEEANDGGSSVYEVETTVQMGYLKRASSQWRNECSLYWMASDGAPPLASGFVPICGFHTPFDIKRGTIWASGNAANYSAIAAPLRNGTHVMTGDLRNTIYTSLPTSATLGHTAHSFATTATFGGANVIQRSSADWMQNPEAKFPDGAYNPTIFGRAPSGSGAYSTLLPGEHGYVTEAQELDTQTPAQPYTTQTAEDQKRYLQHISNQGAYISLGELGNIYDPAQWRGLKRQTTHARQLSLNEETLDPVYSITRTPTYSDYGQDEAREELDNFGGGATLAIGSPEFNAYDPDVDNERVGYEAARLLDLLRVRESSFRSSKARINLNTAPQRVIESLFAGFTHDDDLVCHGGEGFTRQPKALGKDAVASGWSRGIVEHRGRQPYLSLSDIALTKASLQVGAELYEMYLFGEKAMYEANASDANLDLTSFVWNDRGREECFRRMNELFTTKSRSYRLHLQAEYETNGEVRRIQRKVDLTLLPHRRVDLRVESEKSPHILYH